MFRWHSENEQKFGAAGSELSSDSSQIKIPNHARLDRDAGWCQKSMYFAPAFRSALQLTMKE